jgi:hypothetical protein
MAQTNLAQDKSDRFYTKEFYFEIPVVYVASQIYN